MDVRILKHMREKGGYGVSYKRYYIPFPSVRNFRQCIARCQVIHIPRKKLTDCHPWVGKASFLVFLRNSIDILLCEKVNMISEL